MRKLILLFIIIVLFTDVTMFSITKHKTKYVTSKNVFKFLTSYGYNPCEGGFDSKEDKQNRPLCSRKSMLKTFQTRYRLPVTGKLDKTTLKLMNAPRCGSRDLYPLLMIDRSKLWPKNRTLIWKLDFNHILYDKVNIRHQVQQSFDYWAEHIDLTFREATENDVADFNLALVYGEHGDDIPLGGEQDGALAHAFLPWEPYPGQIHFDSTEKWSNKHGDDGFNFKLIATHEIGHSLGLEHSFDPNSIMYAPADLIRPSNILPISDQISIQALYGQKTRTTTEIAAITATSNTDCTRLNLPQGDRYGGDCKDGMKHGRGTYTFADGRKYVGNWVNGKKNGQGVFTWPDGNKYAGEFKDDKFAGGDMSASPLHNDNDAKQKCPGICERFGMKWHGDWTTKITTVTMSICTCTTG